MNHVFVSYVHDDRPLVDRLCRDLRELGVVVWLDRDEIEAGRRWKLAIRDAIQSGALFLACFSSNSVARDRTYMNEEITLAIEELRLRPQDRTWFISVLLDTCQVPSRDIGGGESLRDLQWVDLKDDWQRGVARIAKAAGVPPRERKELEASDFAKGVAIGAGATEILRRAAGALRERLGVTDSDESRSGSASPTATARTTMSGERIRIYIGNLPFAATESEMRALFERFGSVERVQLVTDRETGRPRGFGFLEMEAEGGREAIAQLHGMTLGGRRLNVNEARHRTERGQRR